MIKLYQFPISPVHAIPNFSPFCVKLELFLKVAKLPYEIIPSSDPRKFPKGKLPCIEDDGDIIADSEFSIEHLGQKHSFDIDEHLSPIQKAHAHAYKKLLEDHFYWLAMYLRWVEPSGWINTKRIFFSHLPALPQLFVPGVVLKKMKQDMLSQGTARHDINEILKLADQCLHALSTLLSDQTYFFGSKISSLDLTAFGFLCNTTHVDISPHLNTLSKKYPNLYEYSDRILKTYFK